MASIKVDFTGVEGQKNFEPLPNGRYLVEVVDYKERAAGEKAKNPGAPIVAWQYTVLEGPHEGRSIWDNMPIIPPSEDGESKGTLWRVKAFLEACGFETEGELELDPEEVLNSTLQVKVVKKKGDINKETGEEYDPKNEVKGFFPANHES